MSNMDTDEEDSAGDILHKEGTTKTGQKRVEELAIIQRLSYSVGHVLNDLTASVWFTYMLIYFQDVAGFGAEVSGNIILFGQVVDALCNPLVGMLSDRENCCLRRCGRRRRWHFIGTVAVVISFPLMLHQCLGCDANSPIWHRLLYYIPFVTIFQFGWASAQISHLALIPELTPSEKGRLELNALRYGWTVLSNIFVYGVAWMLFQFNREDSSQKLGENDSFIFEKLSLIIVGIGIIACLIFYVGTKDPSAESTESSSGGTDCVHQGTNRRKAALILELLLDTKFLTAALLYTGARLIINLTQVYVPFFVTRTLDLDKGTIATYPLISYITSFLVATVIKFMAKNCSSQLLYFWGTVNVIGASVWMAFLEPHLSLSTFGTAALSGMGGASIMVTSVSIVSDFIATNTEQSALVFGALGFADKLANGIAVFAIQTSSPCLVTTIDEGCTRYIRKIISIVPGTIAAFSLLVLAFSVLYQRKDTAHWNQKDDELNLLDS